MVEDALGHMTMGSLSNVEEGNKGLAKYVNRLVRLGVRLDDCPNACYVVYNNSELFLLVEVKSKQHFDFLLMELKESVLVKFNESFTQGEMLYLCTKEYCVYQM